MSYDLPERTGSSTGILELATLMLGPAVAWALHLLVVYFLVTIDCVSAWGGSAWAVYVATALFAAAAAAAGWIAWRRWRERDVERAEHLDPQSPRPFVHLLAMASALLFGTAIVVTGTVPLMNSVVC